MMRTKTHPTQVQSSVIKTMLRTQTHPTQVQSSVIKTMILVSAFYVVSCTPVYVYFLLVNVKPDLTLLDTGYYIIKITVMDWVEFGSSVSRVVLSLAIEKG